MGRGVQGAGSRYGRFEVSVGPSSDCIVAFRQTDGTRTSLFTVPACAGDVPGMNTVAATAMIGAVAFPIVGRNGDEFHVFEIASARGATPSRGATTGSS